MRKIFGKHDFYCWNCGERQHTNTDTCPHCGAHYRATYKPVLKQVTTHPEQGARHYTVISYIFKQLLWSCLFAIGWCCIMYFFMDVTFVDERWLVYILLWAFWIAWMYHWAKHKVECIHKVRQYNDSTTADAVCAMCGKMVNHNTNYCPDCGTVIFKSHTRSEVTTEDEARNRQSSSQR